MLKCLTRDPQKRPTALQLLTTPFLFPLHLHQIRRRVETTDVYNTYMRAFEKGWGNLTPMKELCMMENLFYDENCRAFVSQHSTSEAVNVVLPVFECVPDFQSQDHPMEIQNWILASDASFYFAPAKLEEPLEEPEGLSSCGSFSKNTSVNSFTSTGTSPELEDSCLHSGLDKLIPIGHFYPPPQSLSLCGHALPKRSSTCSTTSFESPLAGAPHYEEVDPLGGSTDSL